MQVKKAGLLSGKKNTASKALEEPGAAGEERKEKPSLQAAEDQPV